MASTLSTPIQLGRCRLTTVHRLSATTPDFLLPRRWSPPSPDNPPPLIRHHRLATRWHPRRLRRAARPSVELHHHRHWAGLRLGQAEPTCKGSLPHVTGRWKEFLKPILGSTNYWTIRRQVVWTEEQVLKIKADVP
jgi:hypothetical protein